MDRYSKVLLSVIALILVAMSCKPVSQARSGDGEGALAGVQFSASLDYLYAIDARTGQIWRYEVPTGKVAYAGRLTQLGRPLDRVTPPRPIQ